MAISNKTNDLQVHAVWPHGRDGVAAVLTPGILRLNSEKLTFTEKDGKILVSVPLSDVRKFSGGFVVGRGGGRIFRLVTKDKKTSKV